MQTKVIDLTTFEREENQFLSSNFLQTKAMYEVQYRNPRFSNLQTLAVYDDQVLVAQVMLIYRKRYRFFTEALALHGPLFKDHLTSNQKLEVIESIESYLKRQGIASFTFYPYLVDSVKSDELDILASDLEAPFKEALVKAGYHSYFDEKQEILVNTMFTKDLERFASIDEIHDAFSNSLKRDLKKFSESQVRIEELDESRLEEFYAILEETGKRKGFPVQPLSYFQGIKEAYQDRAQFMLAYLDLEAYSSYLDKHIQDFEGRIKELEEGPQKKRTKGHIADAKDQLRSYYKRKEQLEAIHTDKDRLPLSSYLFISNDKEMVSFAGGNQEDYMNFGGATILHWEMIQQAYAKGCHRFNFYGTIETEASHQGKGNFKFKSQFGGQLDFLMGEFSKTLHPAFALLQKLKK